MPKVNLDELPADVKTAFLLWIEQRHDSVERWELIRDELRDYAARTSGWCGPGIRRPRPDEATIAYWLSPAGNGYWYEVDPHSTLHGVIMRSK